MFNSIWRDARCAAAFAALLAVSSSVVSADSPPGSASDARRFRETYYACMNASGSGTAPLNSCIATEHDYQDARLNKAYKALRLQLPKPDQDKLRDEERQWINERDAGCSQALGGGPTDLLSKNQCLLDRTADRAKDLEER